MTKGTAVQMLAGLIVASAGTIAGADLITVGTGTNSAELYLEFKGGAVYEFEVAFDGTTTGIGLFDIIEAETTLTTDRQDFGFGVFVNGITYDGHSNIGYAGGEDWWHYWTKDGESAGWAAPSVGAVDRVVEDGFSDGWIYGRAGTVPEPASLALMLIGGLLIGKRRR